MTSKQRARKLAETFFGDGNDLRWDDIKKPQQPLAGQIAVSRETIKRLVDGGFSGVLPRRRGNQVVWYGFASSERPLRELGEQLQAFVGSTYSRLEGRAVLDLLDPIEKAVADFGQPYAYLISTDGDKNREALLTRAIARWSACASQSERRGSVRIAPTGRLLAELDEAILLQDWTVASEVVGRLRSQNHLDPVNLAFVDIYLHSSFRKFEEALAIEQLSDVLKVPRPRKVTLAIMSAVHGVYLAPFEDASDGKGGLECFRETVLTEFGSLYLSADGFDDPLAQTHFLMAAIVKGNGQLAASISDRLSGAGSGFVKSLVELVPQSGALSPAEAYERGDLDAAADAMSHEAAGADAVQFLRLLMRQAPSLSKENLLRKTVKELDEAALTVLRTDPSFEAFLASTEASAQNWEEWLRDAASEKLPSGRLSEQAERGATEWTFKGLDPTAIENAFLDILDTEDGRSRLRASAAHVLQSAEKQDYGDEMTSALDSMFHVLGAVCVLGSLTDYRLMARATDLRLAAGIDSRAYSEMIRTLEVLSTPPQLAPANTPGVIEILDALAWNTCPPTAMSKRDTFAARILAAIGGWVDSESLGSNVAWSVRPLAETFGCEELFTQRTQGSEAHHPLDSRRELIGLYTLTPRAAERAKKEIEASSQCRVIIDGSTVNTNSLKNLAERVDLLVIATDSATHAATGALQRQRGDRPTAFADGKGSSSLLRAVYAYYEEHF